MPTTVTYTRVTGDRTPYLPWLQLADDDLFALRHYLPLGELFAVSQGSSLVALALFLQTGTGVELKNFVVLPAWQRQGIGRQVLQYFCQWYAGNATVMTVGTANSSLGPLAFYQRLGFRITAIWSGFFASVEPPIYENGIRARDMVRLTKVLGGSQ